MSLIPINFKIGSGFKKLTILGTTVLVLASVSTLVLVRKLVKAQNVTRDAKILLSSSTAQVKNGDTFTVNVGLESLNQTVVAMDTILSYNNNLLQVTGVDLGNNNDFKTLVPGTDNQIDLNRAVATESADPTASTVEFGLATFDQGNQQLTNPLSGIFDPAASPLATVTFKATKNGNANINLKYVSEAETTDANVVSIVDNQPEDILSSIPTQLLIKILYACSELDFGVVNNRIDVSDIMAVANIWGETSGSPGYSPMFDLDSNGVIDVRDIQTVASRWNEICEYVIAGEKE